MNNAMRQETNSAGPTTATDFNYDVYYDCLVLAICTTYYYLLLYDYDECPYCLLSYEKCVVILHANSKSNNTIEK